MLKIYLSLLFIDVKSDFFNCIVYEYFSKSLFPILKSAEFKKSFLKKIYLIKIDSFDLRLVLDKCESLMA